MGKGPSQATQHTQEKLTQEQIDLANKSEARSSKLYDLTLPGLESAEKFYTTLSTGDPQAIQTATAPATEQISKNYEAAIKNISTTMPRGGARDLAIQEAEISKSGQIGSTKANAYLGSFPALANLAQGGIGLSVNELTQALSAFSGASASNQAAGSMEGAGKAQTLGFIASLGSSAANGAGLAMSCWIAEAIFGETSLHTIRLRAWLNNVFTRTRRGRMFMWFYRHFGQFTARQVRKRNWLRWLVTPLFHWLDRQAYEWEKTWADAFRKAGLF